MAISLCVRMRMSMAMNSYSVWAFEKRTHNQIESNPNDWSNKHNVRFYLDIAW